MVRKHTSVRLGFVLVASLLFPVLACDNPAVPPYPPPDKQIAVQKHYAVTLDGDVETGLQSNNVYDVAVTSTQEVWIGNQDGVAIFGLNAGTRRIEAFDANNGLPNPKLRVIVELGGKLYVGTWGGGIRVFDLAARTWSVLTSEDGLVNDWIADIQVDQGSLYIATNSGVSRYDPMNDPEEAWKSFVKEPGNETDDLLDEFVSAIEIAETPRGKEFWYAPRWETVIEPGTENQHGITVSRGAFRPRPFITTVRAAMDNTLYEDPEGAVSNGACEFMFSGVGVDGLARRAVIKFDLEARIPANTVIRNARLRTYNATDGTYSRVLLHRVTAAWGEGTSQVVGDTIVGAPSTTGDATWKHSFYPTSEWTNPGGDFDPYASAIRFVSERGIYWWSRPRMVTDVAQWHHDPSVNHGWIITSPYSLKRWYTRENREVDRRPILEVTHGSVEVFYFTEATSDFPDPNVNDIFYDETTDLFWIAFSTKGLATVDVEKATWTFHTTGDGLPSNTVYSITEVNGTIWVGTQKGLARHRGDGTFQGYDRGAGLPADRVRKVYSDHPRRLWLGFVGGGAALVDPESAQ